MTEEWRIEDELLKVTLRILMSWITGADIVVISKSMEAANIKITPMV